MNNKVAERLDELAATGDDVVWGLVIVPGQIVAHFPDRVGERVREQLGVLV